MSGLTFVATLAKLVSGSRLDGTGGWRPLELGEIVERWNEFNRGKLPHKSTQPIRKP